MKAQKTRDRDDILDDIESCLEKHMESERQYHESEESPLGEYVSSLFYGEADFDSHIDLRNLEDLTVKGIKTARKVLGDEKTLDLMRENSHLEFSDMWINNSEWLTASAYESEIQIDSVEYVNGLADLLAEAGPLSDEEIEKLERYTGIRDLRRLFSGEGHVWGYISHGCDRFCLIITDEDEFRLELEKALVDAVL